MRFMLSVYIKCSMFSKVTAINRIMLVNSIEVEIKQRVQ